MKQTEAKREQTEDGNKPIEQLNLNRDDWKKETGVANLGAGVKMKHIEQKNINNQGRES